MARLPRLNLAGIPQHIVQRGNNRQVCFFSEQDYTAYLYTLKEYSQKYKVDVHSYVLMTNHVHLLLTPKDANGVSRLMQSLGRYYVRYINQVYSRTGTLWEGRFKSSVVDSENYFLTVSRYIEQNPLRANMVEPEYPWSSYQKNAMGKLIELITPHYCYLSLGKNDEERQETYRSLFEHEIPDYTLTEIREAINKTWILGDNRFRQQIEAQTGRYISQLPHGGDRKSKKYKIDKHSQLFKQNQLL